MFQLLLQTLLLLFVIGSANDSVSVLQDNYGSGLQLLERGEIDSALDRWLLEWKQVQADSSYQMDPRAAFAFINTAAAYNRNSAYKVASQFYIESLYSSKMDEVFKEVEEDLKLISFLLPRNEAKWVKKLRTPLPTDFSSRMTDLWFSLDSNPLTPYNESLIGFYQRKHEADSLLPKVSYKDDRKSIYLKFGEPRSRVHGTYVPNMLNISSIIEKAGGGRLYFTYVRNHLIGFSFRYETWSYSDEKIIFINESGAEYKEILPDDILPSALKRLPNVRSIEWEVPSVVPKFFVLHDMYSFMSTKSQFYANQFSNVQTVAQWLGTSQQTPSLRAEAEIVSNFSSSALTIKKFIRPETNIQNTNNLKIHLEYQQYHFHRPDSDSVIHVTATFAQFDSLENENNFSFDLNLETISTPNVTLTRVFGDKLSTNSKIRSKMARFETRKPWYKSVFSSINQQSSSISTATEREAIRVDATVPMVRPEQGDTAHIFLGIGNSIIDYSTSKLDSDRLAISDIVLGFKHEQIDTSKTELFSFHVPKDQQIPASENLALYFEVYNLDKLGFGESEYEVRLNVREDRFIQLPDRFRKGGTILRLSGMRSWEPLELEYVTQKLDIGDYELRVEVIHKETEQRVRTRIPFRIVEP